MKARTYSPVKEHMGCNVVELHWMDGWSVQISGSESDDPRGKHIMLRAWGRNGTHEYGGDNGNNITLVLEPDGDEWKVTTLNYRGRGHKYGVVNEQNNSGDDGSK